MFKNYDKYSLIFQIIFKPNFMFKLIPLLRSFLFLSYQTNQNFFCQAYTQTMTSFEILLI